MEILFKNVTTLDEEKYFELVKFHNKKNNLKYHLYTAAIAFCMVVGIAFQIHQKTYISLVILAVALVGFLAYRTFTPYKKTKQEVEGDKIKNNLVNTYIFYDKKIIIKNINGKDELKYHKLYKVYENKNAFYLYLDKNNTLIVQKDGFKIGTSKDFKNFIKKKVKFKFKK